VGRKALRWNLESNKLKAWRFNIAFRHEFLVSRPPALFPGYASVNASGIAACWTLTVRRLLRWETAPGIELLATP
jgi:hypothetical protein